MTKINVVFENNLIHCQKRSIQSYVL